jgi:CheY-like chemotaxis protein
MTRILIVDDDPDARAVTRLMLENAGVTVVEAEDGAAGIQAFRDVGADLVLCDVFMPGVDGIEVIRELRRESPRVKIVAMSAGGFAGRVDMLAVARRVGAVEVLHKPFTQQALLETVGRSLPPPSGVD